VPREPKHSEQKKAGYAVLFVTVDGAAPGVGNGMMRPPFRTVATPGEFQTGSDPSLTWKDVAWLRSIVRMPIVLKGIIDPASDDRRASRGHRQGRRTVPVLLDGGLAARSLEASALAGAVKRADSCCGVLQRGVQGISGDGHPPMTSPTVRQPATGSARPTRRAVLTARLIVATAMVLTARAGPPDSHAAEKCIMNTTERRKAKRREETFIVSLIVTSPLELEGHTVNLSREGVLLTAQGRIHVILDMKGQQYHGVLVRARPADGGKTAYAIQLTDTLETEQA